MPRGYERTVKPNGSVLARVVTGYVGTRPVRESKTFPRGTREEVIAAWALTTKAAHPYEVRKPGRSTKPDTVIQEWLADRKAHIAPRTYLTYEAYSRLYLIGRLSRFDSDAMAALFREVKRLDGQALSPYTMQTIRFMLKSVLEFALERGYIDGVPKMPKLGGLRRAKRIQALSQRDYHRLRAHLREHGELELELMLVTGLRVSEVTALEPRQVSNAVHVDQARMHRWGSREVGPPKSRSSYRTIEVETSLLKLLLDHISDLPAGERFVFHLGPTGLAKRLEKARNALNLPKLTLHGLRHSHCTFLLSRGDIPIHAIAERMGHHSPDFTLRRYSHLVPGMDRGIGEAIRSHRTRDVSAAT